MTFDELEDKVTDHDPGAYVYYNDHTKEMRLDGDFNLDSLRLMVSWMEAQPSGD